MKIADLDFQAAGCCGEYRSAKVERDGVTFVVFDDGNSFRLVKIVGGIAAEPPRHGLTAAEIEAALS